ncbi:MAG: hypothetical protein KDD89_12080, partial [Anaerolineales bacterium]|nr:hypothetical protein [Anaerolineales bacterium]
AATSAPPAPANPLPAPLEDGITFLGYDQPARVAAGETVDITLHWHATDTPSQDYTVFFQLLDTNNTYIAGADSPPLNGDYPTSLWQPDDTITETRQLTLPADLPPGNYFIATGLYDPATGARLPLVGGRGTDTITWRFTVGE